jgi:hypothetical protein
MLDLTAAPGRGIATINADAIVQTPSPFQAEGRQYYLWVTVYPWASYGDPRIPGLPGGTSGPAVLEYRQTSPIIAHEAGDGGLNRLNAKVGLPKGKYRAYVFLMATRHWTDRTSDEVLEPVTNRAVEFDVK